MRRHGTHFLLLLFLLLFIKCGLFQPLLWIPLLLSILGFTGYWLVNIVRPSTSVPYRCVCSISIAIVASWCVLIVENFKHGLTYRAGVVLQLPSYRACASRDGVVFDNGYRLAVCDVQREPWSFGVTNALVYDSSDEILRAPKNQSSSWKAAAESLSQNAPFGVAGYEANCLRGHYFFVRFYEDMGPVYTKTKLGGL
jgi:hypothetical protein